MNEFLDYFKGTPVVSLLFCGLLIIIILMQCLTKKIFYKVRFFAGAFVTASTILILVFYNQMKNSEYEFFHYFPDVALVVIDVLLVVLLFTSIDFSFTSEVLNKELTKVIDQNRNYALLDKRDRVKEISTSLAEELGITKSEAYGKNFFDVIEINNRIVGINGEEAYKDEIKKFYARYKRDKSRIVSDFEITVTVGDTPNRSVMFFTETNIFNHDKYKGRLFYGNKKNEEELVGLERDYEITTTKLENLKNRLAFISSKSQEGFYFYNVTKKEIWFNKVLVKKLALDTNTMAPSDFMARIHPSDVELYTDMLKNPKSDYELTYRFKVGAYYVNINEVGRKNTTDYMEVCGIMRTNDDFSFERTNSLLDKIKTEEMMKNKYLELLKEENSVFEVVYLKLNEIPEVNEKYGRPIGNDLMAKFIYRFTYNYLPEGYLYRVGGLEFVGFLTNVNRIAALREHLLESEDKVLTISTDVANEKIKTKVYLGIALSKDDQYHKDKTLEHAKAALMVSLNDKYTSKYVNYKDIKNR